MILLTGGSGFLGWNLIRSAPPDTDLTATYHRHHIPVTERPGVRWVQMDLDSESTIRQSVKSSRPAALIHAAALKDVDLCQEKPDLAEKWNVRATEILCDAAKSAGARVILVSTDLVFDGSRSFWKETDVATGSGVYPQTKRAAEEIVLSFPENAVVRVALLYGWSNGVNKSFIDWMWSRLGAGRGVPLFTDQHRTPLLAEEAGEALLRVARDRDITGLFHLGGPERLSRFEFGVKVCEHFPFDPRYLQPMKMSEATGFSPRAADCSLNSAKLAAALNLKFSGVDEGLDKMAAL